MADISMKDRGNNIENKYEKNVCLYSGSIKRVYGISALVEGFLMAKIQNSELHIYGEGDYATELQDICERFPQIKFWGTVTNEKVVEEQVKATLLINPRPNTGEYTMYSFPSKNIEYMASGTPALATKLPGIPKEYFEYNYIIEESTPEAICCSLQHVFSHSRKELHKKGAAARRFVMENKNNLIQARRVAEMLDENK